jgi:hypothetical protein
MTVSEDFTSLTGRFRGELLAHCEAHVLQVLTVTPAGVARLVIFLDPALFRTFGPPPRYGAAEAAPAAC